MACAGCSVGAALHKSNPVSGCNSGGCSTGGCNRLNTYDWLANIPMTMVDADNLFVEVSFKNGARKDFYRNANRLLLDKMDNITVECETGGYDVGTVSLTGEMARLQMKRKKIPETDDKLMTVLRVANDYDMQKMQEARAQEKETMVRARATARSMGLNMKIGDVEYQGDGRKATFYYTADERVDFRELIKVLAKEFRIKVEMHQIGARQEAGRIGGIGSCGRELCCSTWLTEFKSVTTAAARYQNLAINQVKLSGQCGRLKCCLNYELDTYLDALKDIPTHVEKLETDKGILFLQKTDIFKKIMWYAYKDHTGYRTMTTERVLELEQMNKDGVKPADNVAVSAAQPDRVKKGGAIEEDAGFADTVGQTSLRSLDKHNRNKKKPKRNDGNAQRQPQQAARNEQGANQQPSRNAPQQPQKQQPQRDQRNQPNTPKPSNQHQANQPNQPPRNTDAKRNEPREQRSSNRPPRRDRSRKPSSGNATPPPNPS